MRITRLKRGLLTITSALAMSAWGSANASISNTGFSNTDTTVSYRFNYNTAGMLGVRVFIDTDNDRTTGYASGAGIGPDYLIQNNEVYKYSGTAGAWGFTKVGSTTVFGNVNSTANFSVSRSAIGQTKLCGESEKIAFQVYKTDGSVDTSTAISHTYANSTTCTSGGTNPGLVVGDGRHPFPRLGGYTIGSDFNRYYTNAFLDFMKKVDVLITGSPHWKSTLNTQITTAKTANPGLKVFLYTNADDILKASADPAHPYYDKYQNVVANGWRAVTGAGALVNSTYIVNGVPIAWQGDVSTYSKKDASGHTYMQWLPTWNIATVYDWSDAADGLYMDNVFDKPRVSADWNHDGTTDSTGNATVQQWYRNAFVQYFQTLRNLMPGKLQIGNQADWDNTADLVGYKGLMDGGVFEHMQNVDKFNGFNAMMNQYQTILNYSGNNKYVICSVDGDPTNYQSVRYLLGACLLKDGYFYFNDDRSGKDYSVESWFDEYNVSLGWPKAAAYKLSNGVWRRDFDHGIVLTNPTGNGQQTVSGLTGYKHVKGTQVPLINDGSPVSSVVLKDRDGLILLK